MLNKLNSGPAFFERANLYAREHNLTFKQACSVLGRRRRRRQRTPVDPAEVFAREERMNRA